MIRRMANWRIPLWRIVAVVVVSFLSLGTSIVAVSTKDSSAPTVMVAELADASPLLPGNDVKVDGVRVGKVSAIYVSHGHANVSFSVDPEALPIHRDAQASVRPVSLLGERYLDVQRGTPSSPSLGQGGVIPLRQTKQATDLDQILNVLDDKTGQPLAALITVLGQGSQGNGQNVGDTVKALAPAMSDTDGMMKILNQQNGTLNSLVDNVSPVAQSLARDNGKTMDGLVDTAHGVLGTTAANQQALNDSLAQLPQTLAQARSTFQSLTGTANNATPTLKAIRPTTDNLQSISKELGQFSDAADPALARARPVLDRAHYLLDEARPVSEELQKSGPPLRSDASSARPVVNNLAGNFNNVLNFVRGWALSTNGSDGIAHYFRAMVIATPNIGTGAVPGAGSVPGPGPVGMPRPPLPRGLPMPLPGGIPTPPILGGAPGGGPADGLLPPNPPPGGGVTGLQPKQESGALQFLLGGQ